MDWSTRLSLCFVRVEAVEHCIGYRASSVPRRPVSSTPGWHPVGKPKRAERHKLSDEALPFRMARHIACIASVGRTRYSTPVPDHKSMKVKLQRKPESTSRFPCRTSSEFRLYDNHSGCSLAIRLRWINTPQATFMRFIIPQIRTAKTSKPRKLEDKR